MYLQRLEITPGHNQTDDVVTDPNLAYYCFMSLYAHTWLTQGLLFDEEHEITAVSVIDGHKVVFLCCVVDVCVVAGWLGSWCNAV